MTERVHATCVALDGRGVLLMGPAGSGKSDLALRLIAGGAALVADDQVELAARDGMLHASPPAALAGLIEARGIGLLRLPHETDVAVALACELVAAPPERLPAPATATLAGVAVPLVRIAPFEASAPAKLRLVLRHGPAHTDLAPG